MNSRAGLTYSTVSSRTVRTVIQSNPVLGIKKKKIVEKQTQVPERTGAAFPGSRRMGVLAHALQRVAAGDPLQSFSLSIHEQ